MAHQFREGVAMLTDDAPPPRAVVDGTEPNRQDSPATWLFRGLMAGVLAIGSANALSFFFRSRGWGSLLGSRDPGDEAIGFPLRFWQEGSGYGSHPLEMIPFLVDVGAALLLGSFVGGIAIWQRPTLNQILNRYRGRGKRQEVRLQFSLRGLLITTVLSALAAAAARSFAPRVEVLAAIYALGPVSLIVLAYLPRGLRWQQRAAILTPATIILIAVAIALGLALNVEFDKVLMGIFICWTPQAAIGAAVLTCWLLFREYRQIRRELAP